MVSQDSQTVAQGNGGLRWLSILALVLGVAAFAWIIGDRLRETFQLSNSVDADVAQDVMSAEEQASKLRLVTAETDIVEDSSASMPSLASASALVTSDDLTLAREATTGIAVVADELAAPDELEAIFGSRVVFVSAMSPQYLLTEKELRYDIGGSINADTTLAAVSMSDVTLNTAGTLRVFKLPASAE